MSASWCVFILMWWVFAWTLWRPPSKNLANIQIQTPMFRRECATQDVPCVDHCGFLCVESEAMCVGGKCLVQDSLKPVECRQDRGGMIVMVNDPTPRWTCLCTDNAFWGGEKCDELNPDVCEHGVFLYSYRNKFNCICPEPYKMVTLQGKPHCLERGLANFFPQEPEKIYGPSLRVFDDTIPKNSP